ncbi:phage baseplate assembly protein V [Histophilus somni]|uniref:Phage baseplate assembly protein V n=1 Tax=Histophilus somni TaxID=731 RepID=A0AAX2S311_HISSO|nr:phage baseplate assembly protein V [Histophilus somni]ACA32343.1 phage baseplate assembly protein V [Histophilus somni 2336]TDF40581.1 phage baseplate assembly protein V [Histophilus somni]TEW29001.1 phage baseplate assembly protein V [Histophilus somni]TFF01126.1 phage baseplate assembly protein V [Histophilus somni]THA21739.1 phage baseplate assembly protein V [Histophilus somni]
MRRFSQAIQQTAQTTLNGVRQAFRGVLNLVNSADNIQKTQVSGLADETLQDVELMQHFGFTSVPPAGTQAVIIPIGGQTSHGIVVATENGAFRVKNLQGGEVAIYDQSGSTIVLKQGRLIEVDCDDFVLNCKTYQVNATTGANFDTPKLETTQVLTAQGKINGNGGMAVQGGSGATFNGDVTQIGGNITTDGDVNASGKSLVNHTHRGDSGGNTGSPQ